MIILHLPSWFPHPEKPLDGNFILRQIATVADKTTSIVLHHADASFLKNYDDLLDKNIIFKPILTQSYSSKFQMVHAYEQAVKEVIHQYGKPDIIHLHVALPLGPLAVYLSRKYNIPLIISEHWSVYQPQNRGQLSGKQQWHLRHIYQRAQHLTCVSDNLHQAIVDTVPAAQRVHYTQVSNVVDTTLFHAASEPAGERSTSVKRILHVSTLDDNAKNIMGILRMVKRLAAQRSDFELNIIHDLRNEAVEQFIQEEHLENFVHLLGKKSEEEVADAIRECDFMLQFSNYENQPCVLLESFCCGKPVVATTVGGIPEIANRKNARLIAPRNEEMLLDQTDYMLDHAHEYEADSISSDAQQKYDVSVIGERFMEVYGKTCH